MSEKKKMSRRDFLRAATAGGAVIAGVGGNSLQAEGPAHGLRLQEGPVELTYMIWGDANRKDTDLQIFYEAYPELESQYTIKVVSGGSNSSEAFQSLRLALAAGTGIPDFQEFTSLALPEFAMAGVVTDLTEYMEPLLVDLTEAGKRSSRYNGTYYAIPSQVKTKLWYYRSDMFEEAGINAEEIQTNEDYLAAAEKFHEVFPDSYMLNMGPQPEEYMYFLLTSHWPDVRVADETGKYYITEHPAFARMMEYLGSWHNSGNAAQINDFDADWGPAMADGTIAGWLGVSWGNEFVPRFAPELGGQWSIALWPEFNRMGDNHGAGIHIIPEASLHKDLAFDFISKAFIETPGAVARWENKGIIPPTFSGQERVQEIAADMTKPEWMTDEQWQINAVNYFGSQYLDKTIESFDTLQIMEYDPAASLERAILAEHTMAYMAGSQSLEEALANAQADMEQQIGNPYDI